MDDPESVYNELAQCSIAHASKLQSGWPLCCVSSRCRTKIERRYVGLREATGELVAKKTLQPDERSEPILDLLTVKQISLLPYDTLPTDLADLHSELNTLALYPHRLLIRYKGGFVPNWLLFLDSDNIDYWHLGLMSYLKLLDELSNENLIEMLLWRDYYRLASVGSTYSQFYLETTLQPEELDPAWNLSVSEKELRDWLATNMNAVFKPSHISKLMESYLPAYKHHYGSFQTFVRMLQICLWSSQKALDQLFQRNFPRVTHFTSKVTAPELEQFAWQCQGEQPDFIDRLLMSSGIKFKSDGTIVFSEFLDMLFCKANSITDDNRTKCVYQSMDFPLSAYYISTSHNTYLSGDQVRSESNVQCYVSALRQGCRCLELDLWDGTKGTPVIYHGHTLTSKIDLEPALLAIREHAFERTDTPLILSLEDHCSLQQQARTADLLIQVFGQNLLTSPLTSAQEQHLQQLPSPSQLRYRVLIKHDKIKNRLDIGAPNDPAVTAAMVAAAASSLNQSAAAADAPTIHTGRVQVQNPVSNHWEQYVAVLTGSHLLFMNDDTAKASTESSSNRRADEDLSALKTYVWFHCDIDRPEAEARIRRWCGADNEGRFLVRPSPTNPGDFALSFINRGVIQHCHIRKSPDPMNANRWLFSIPNVRSPEGTNEQQRFAKMSDLIDFYRNFGIDQGRYFLTKPVPHDLSVFPWYLGEITKKSAEDLLRQVPYSGAYLVRLKSGDCVDGEFVLAFRSEREIKRCIISCRAGKAIMANFPESNSLAQLIDHFGEQPIYRNIRLRYPINARAVEKIARSGVCSTDGRVVCESDYHGLIQLEEGSEESLLDNKPDAAMRVTCAYNSKASDELTVKPGDILIGATRVSPEWWIGTLESSGAYGLVPAAVLEPCNTGEYVEISIPVRGIKRVQIPPEERCPPEQQWCSLCIEFEAANDPSGSASHQMVMRMPTQVDLCEWIKQIELQRRKHFGTVVGDSGSMRRERIAQRLSDLVVYCVPTRSPEQKIRFQPSKFYEMVSVSETRLPKNLNCQLARDIKDFTLNQLVRVYPKTMRFNSSNFNPLPAWELGCQMVALNWQTNDRAMVLNRALFADNGGCGYVLKPEFYRQQTEEAQIVDVKLRVLAGRRLPRTSPQITSSYVEAELYRNRSRSPLVPDNGLNPVYRDCTLNVTGCPIHSILRISVVTESEAWHDPLVIGTFARPIRTLRSGYRSVALCDEFGDEIPACSLLVHLVISR